MKLNENIAIKGDRLLLVPYEKYHVEKYNEWMQSEELLNMTGSVRLTIEQEYDMQKTWREDENKCTFIILDSSKYYRCRDEIDSMIGDVNLFIENEDTKSAEISMMIAENGARRRGFGSEALKLILLFGVKFLNLKRYLVKISKDNAASINFFSRHKFHVISESVIFNEVTMERTILEESFECLQSNCAFQEITYSSLRQSVD